MALPVLLDAVVVASCRGLQFALSQVAAVSHSREVRTYAIAKGEFAVPITLTGDNNDSGVYSNVDVLGGANHGGTTSTDTNAFVGLDPLGTEFFLFGFLNHSSTKVFSGDVLTGSYTTNGSGSAGDTLVFDFTFTAGGSGGGSNFLTSGFAPGAISLDSDGDAVYQSPAAAMAWTVNYAAWQASFGAGVTFSGSTTIETGVSGPHDPDVNLTFDITASGGTAPTLTSDYAGQKVLLGFAPGSDHLDLNGHSILSEAQFDQFFQVTASSHQSANHNTVVDTVVSLNDGSWSVDLYGVDASALTAAYNTLHGTSLTTVGYVYDVILAH